MLSHYYIRAGKRGHDRGVSHERKVTSYRLAVDILEDLEYWCGELNVTRSWLVEVVLRRHLGPTVTKMLDILGGNYTEEGESNDSGE